jgi:hypothetical protein
LALSRSFTIKAAKLLARLYPKQPGQRSEPLALSRVLPNYWQDFIRNNLANGQSRWRSAGPCQTVGKALSGFALPTALFFL